MKIALRKDGEAVCFSCSLRHDLSNRLDQFHAFEGAEELKGVRLSIFLAHEQQRQLRSEQQQRGGQPLGRRAHERAEPLPIGAVTHLIMILNAADEPIPWQARGGRAMAAVAMLAVAPIKDKGVLDHFP